MSNTGLVAQDHAVAGAERTDAGRWALTSLALSMLLSSLGTSGANVAVPTLAQDFDAPFQQVQWVVLAYLLAITSLIVFVGRLGDLIGRRRLMLTGISLFTLASALCGMAPTLWLLVAARAVQGCGAAVLMALTVALVGETIPTARLGSAMGLLGTMSAVGTALGPSLGGALIAGPGWRAIFLVNVPLGVFAASLAQRHLPGDNPRPNAGLAGLDPAGTLLMVLTLAAYALAMTTGYGGFAPLNAALLLAAAVGLGFFLRAEARAGAPLIPLAMLRHPVLRANLAMNTLVSTVMMATLVVGPLYLSRGLELDPARVGLILSVGPLIAALSGVPGGRLVDRYGARRMLSMGLLSTGAGALMLATSPLSVSIRGYLVAITIITAGYALFQAANNTVVMTGINAEQRGVVSALLSLSRNLGLITGASAMGAVFALGSATVDLTTAPPEAIAIGMRATFLVASLLIVVALAIATGGGVEQPSLGRRSTRT